jgi:hypothetical protein
MATLLPAFRLLLLLILTDAAEDDAAALVRLKASLTDPGGALEAWSASSPSPPCDGANPWPGVQCYKGALAGLRLTGMNLSGTFDFAAISRLRGLHSVNLKRNAFSGPLPASLVSARSLRALYLSYNSFTGPVPGEVFAALPWLKKLYLDHNALSGHLPADALADAPRLLELHLQFNRVEGAVPTFLPASLHMFNVSHNQLSGEIPRGVATRYEASAFAGNPALCGAPGSAEAACAALMPTPTPMPPPTMADNLAVQEETSAFAVIGIILLVIVLVTGAMVLMLRQDELNSSTAPTAAAWDYAAAAVVKSPVSPTQQQRAAEMVAVDVGSSHGGGGSSHGGSGGSRKMGEFVLMRDDIAPFGLPELMKASAEVLGNGTLGSAYKAAMRNGVTVAVKRMRDMNRVGRAEFEQHVLVLSELRHPNVLPPVGFHYRKEEKLIVSEYMPRGSLLYVLHGKL